MSTIYDIIKKEGATKSARPYTDEYKEKMLHAIPDAESINRSEFILNRCKGKDVLNLGSASGELHKAIKSIAKSVIGVDIVQPCDIMINLDYNPERLPLSKVDLIVAGEIIEHLGNPGNLLKSLRRFDCPLLVTAPNAFSQVAFRFIAERVVENVNKDHVAWYSYKTLCTLLERYGFKVDEFHWYKGKPRLSEGLIMVAS